MRKINFNITSAEEGAAFAVQIVPKSVRNEVVGKHGDALKINLIATTVGGAANDMLIKFVAKQLGIDTKKVEIAAGQTSAQKMVVVLGLQPSAVEETLLG
ncbi:MAG: DUF167 domain-containing protein [Chloroflexota bacterium]